MAKKEQRFSSAMNRLEEVAKQLEQGDIELEEALKLYEEGMQLVKSCTQRLEEAHATIVKLSVNADGDISENEVSSGGDLA